MKEEFDPFVLLVEIDDLIGLLYDYKRIKEEYDKEAVPLTTVLEGLNSQEKDCVAGYDTLKNGKSHRYYTFEVLEQGIVYLGLTKC